MAHDDLTPALETPAGRYKAELSRSLSVRENILITLSAVTPASSLFVIAPAVINGIGGAAVLAYTIAALIGIAVALCYAELSSAYPITGGEYTFVARTLGRPAGFALFVQTLVSTVLITAIIAEGAGMYLAVLWPDLNAKAVGTAIIVAATITACFSIRLNALITGVVLLLEVALLAVVAVLGFLHVSQPISTLWTPTTVTDGGVLVAASAGLVVSYIATALFAYNGYGTAVCVAEETRQASRTIGRAILWSLAISVLTQLIPLIAVVLGSPNMTEMVGSDDPLSYFVQSRGGTVLEDMVSLGIAVAIINAILAGTLQQARKIYSSARDRSWPDVINRTLSRVNPRFKTPVAATLVFGVLSAAVLATVPFDVLLVITGASLLIIYALVALGALAGRINGSTRRAVFKMPLWPWIPLAMIAATLCITYQNLVTDWVPVAATVAIAVIGLPYYYLFIRRRGDRWTLPDPVDDSESA